jgi:hypothetical protein
VSVPQRPWRKAGASTAVQQHGGETDPDSKERKQSMSYVNGSGRESPVSESVAAVAANGNHSAQVSPEHLSKIRERLSEPFDPSEIKWRVTATSTQQTKHGPQKRGQLIAYADQRAYTDRLNEVFGEWGWTRDYDVQVAQNFERRAPGDKKETAVAAKVVVVSKVTIHGLGSHTGVGEEWADDQNAATRAEAQAFKRACACFGLGRYLYDLDKIWIDLDQYNRPVHTPSLPDWALPGYAQREAQRQAGRSRTEPRQSLVRDELLAKVQELREKVGYSLSLYVLNKYAGGTEPDKIGHAKLSIVFEKLTDIGNGIDRLRRAAAIIGDSRYADICRELNLASESIDDIPDRDALKRLLARLEAEVTGKNGSHTQGAPAMPIGDARGRLLQAARKMADKTGKRLADVISEASDGRLTLDGLKNLTDSDVTLVSAATARMA